eukprot:gene1823-1109_t
MCLCLCCLWLFFRPLTEMCVALFQTTNNNNNQLHVFCLSPSLYVGVCGCAFATHTHKRLLGSFVYHPFTLSLSPSIPLFFSFYFHETHRAEAERSARRKHKDYRSGKETNSHETKQQRESYNEKNNNNKKNNQTKEKAKRREEALSTLEEEEKYKQLLAPFLLLHPLIDTETLPNLSFRSDHSQKLLFPIARISYVHYIYIYTRSPPLDQPGTEEEKTEEKKRKENKNNTRRSTPSQTRKRKALTVRGILPKAHLLVRSFFGHSSSRMRPCSDSATRLSSSSPSEGSPPTPRRASPRTTTATDAAFNSSCNAPSKRPAAAASSSTSIQKMGGLTSSTANVPGAVVTGAAPSSRSSSSRHDLFGRSTGSPTAAPNVAATGAMASAGGGRSGFGHRSGSSSSSSVRSPLTGKPHTPGAVPTGVVDRTSPGSLPPSQLIPPPPARTAPLLGGLLAKPKGNGKKAGRSAQAAASRPAPARVSTPLVNTQAAATSTASASSSQVMAEEVPPAHPRTPGRQRLIDSPVSLPDDTEDGGRGSSGAAGAWSLGVGVGVGGSRGARSLNSNGGGSCHAAATAAEKAEGEPSGGPSTLLIPLLAPACSSGASGSRAFDTSQRTLSPPEAALRRSRSALVNTGTPAAAAPRPSAALIETVETVLMARATPPAASAFHSSMDPTTRGRRAPSATTDHPVVATNPTRHPSSSRKPAASPEDEGEVEVGSTGPSASPPALIPETISKKSTGPAAPPPEGTVADDAAAGSDDAPLLAAPAKAKKKKKKREKLAAAAAAAAAASLLEEEGEDVVSPATSDALDAATGGSSPTGPAPASPAVSAAALPTASASSSRQQPTAFSSPPSATTATPGGNTNASLSVASSGGGSAPFIPPQHSGGLGPGSGAGPYYHPGYNSSSSSSLVYPLHQGSMLHSSGAAGSGYASYMASGVGGSYPMMGGGVPAGGCYYANPQADSHSHSHSGMIAQQHGYSGGGGGWGSQRSGGAAGLYSSPPQQQQQQQQQQGYGGYDTMSATPFFPPGARMPPPPPHPSSGPSLSATQPHVPPSNNNTSTNSGASHSSNAGGTVGPAPATSSSASHGTGAAVRGHSPAPPGETGYSASHRLRRSPPPLTSSASADAPQAGGDEAPRPVPRKSNPLLSSSSSSRPLWSGVGSPPLWAPPSQFPSLYPSRTNNSSEGSSPGRHRPQAGPGGPHTKGLAGLQPKPGSNGHADPALYQGLPPPTPSGDGVAAGNSGAYPHHPHHGGGLPAATTSTTTTSASTRTTPDRRMQDDPDMPTLLDEEVDMDPDLEAMAAAAVAAATAGPTSSRRHQHHTSVPPSPHGLLPEGFGAAALATALYDRPHRLCCTPEVHPALSRLVESEVLRYLTPTAAGLRVRRIHMEQVACTLAEAIAHAGHVNRRTAYGQIRLYVFGSVNMRTVLPDGDNDVTLEIDGLLPNAAASSGAMSLPPRSSSSSGRSGGGGGAAHNNTNAVTGAAASHYTAADSATGSAEGALQVATAVDGEPFLAPPVALSLAAGELLQGVRDYLVMIHQQMDSPIHVDALVSAEVKVLKLIMNGYSYDVTVGQAGGVNCVQFFHELDETMGHQHLLKRTMLLLKAWFSYEAHILGGQGGYLGSYAVSVLLISMLNIVEFLEDVEEDDVSLQEREEQQRREEKAAARAKRKQKHGIAGRPSSGGAQEAVPSSPQGGRLVGKEEEEEEEGISPSVDTQSHTAENSGGSSRSNSLEPTTPAAAAHRSSGGGVKTDSSSSEEEEEEEGEGEEGEGEEGETAPRRPPPPPQRRSRFARVTPMVLCARFLKYYAYFDFTHYCVTAFGPLKLSYMTNPQHGCDLRQLEDTNFLGLTAEGQAVMGHLIRRRAKPLLTVSGIQHLLHAMNMGRREERQHRYEQHMMRQQQQQQQAAGSGGLYANAMAPLPGINGGLEETNTERRTAATASTGSRTSFTACTDSCCLHHVGFGTTAGDTEEDESGAGSEDVVQPSYLHHPFQGRRYPLNKAGCAAEDADLLCPSCTTALFPVRSMNILDPLRWNSNMARGVCKNHMQRILLAFREGVRRLAKASADLAAAAAAAAAVSPRPTTATTALSTPRDAAPVMTSPGTSRSLSSDVGGQLNSTANSFGPGPGPGPGLQQQGGPPAAGPHSSGLSFTPRSDAAAAAMGLCPGYPAPCSMLTAAEVHVLRNLFGTTIDMIKKYSACNFPWGVDGSAAMPMPPTAPRCNACPYPSVFCTECCIPKMCEPQFCFDPPWVQHTAEDMQELRCLGCLGESMLPYDESEEMAAQQAAPHGGGVYPEDGCLMDEEDVTSSLGYTPAGAAYFTDISTAQPPPHQHSPHQPLEEDQRSDRDAPRHSAANNRAGALGQGSTSPTTAATAAAHPHPPSSSSTGCYGHPYNSNTTTTSGGGAASGNLVQQHRGHNGNGLQQHDGSYASSGGAATPHSNRAGGYHSGSPAPQPSSTLPPSSSSSAHNAMSPTPPGPQQSQHNGSGSHHHNQSMYLHHQQQQQQQQQQHGGYSLTYNSGGGMYHHHNNTNGGGGVPLYAGQTWMPPQQQQQQTMQMHMLQHSTTSHSTNSGGPGGNNNSNSNNSMPPPPQQQQQSPQSSMHPLDSGSAGGSYYPSFSSPMLPGGGPYRPPPGGATLPPSHSILSYGPQQQQQQQQGGGWGGGYLHSHPALHSQHSSANGGNAPGQNFGTAAGININNNMMFMMPYSSGSSTTVGGNATGTSGGGGGSGGYRHGCSSQLPPPQQQLSYGYAPSRHSSNYGSEGMVDVYRSSNGGGYVPQGYSSGVVDQPPPSQPPSRGGGGNAYGRGGMGGGRGAGRGAGANSFYASLSAAAGNANNSSGVKAAGGAPAGKSGMTTTSNSAVGGSSGSSTPKLHSGRTKVSGEHTPPMPYMTAQNKPAPAGIKPNHGPKAFEGGLNIFWCMKQLDKQCYRDVRSTTTTNNKKNMLISHGKEKIKESMHDVRGICLPVCVRSCDTSSLFLPLLLLLGILIASLRWHGVKKNTELVPKLKLSSQLNTFFFLSYCLVVYENNNQKIKNKGERERERENQEDTSLQVLNDVPQSSCSPGPGTGGDVRFVCLPNSRERIVRQLLVVVRNDHFFVIIIIFIRSSKPPPSSSSFIAEEEAIREERRARKERERAERKAKEAGASESPETKKETEEERRARKERERAERKAKEAGASESPETKKRNRGRTADQKKQRKNGVLARSASVLSARRRKLELAKAQRPKKETEEERRARKERERAERKAKEAGASESPETKKETEEERRARKERERAERKAKEAGASESPETKKETEEERRARKERERAERKAKEDEIFGSRNNSSAVSGATRPVSKHQTLIDAIEEENRVATSRGSAAASSRLGSDGSPGISQEEQDRERRREERRLRKEKKIQEQEKDGAGLTGSSVGKTDVSLNILERQGYRQQFEKDLARATALRRLVDFDDFSVVVVDIAPQSEYDMYIRQFGQGRTAQVGTRAPELEDSIDAEVQAERSKRKHRLVQSPDDLGLCPEQAAERQRLARQRSTAVGGDSDDENEAVRSPASPKGEMASPTGVGTESPSGAGGGALLGVDSGLLGSFLNRVFPLVSALLDENSAEDRREVASLARAKSSTSFSSHFTSLNFDGVQNRPVLQIRFSLTNQQSVAALYGAPASGQAGPSPELDVFPSVILQWNTHDSFRPERALVAFSPLTCLCFSPSRPHLVYAGTEAGCVCVWDTREPDRQHLSAGRYKGLVLRLPSYSTTWKADNHSAAVADMCVAGYNTVVGVRREEFEQLVSLDRSGQTKFWAMNEKSNTGKEVSEHDHGLHMFSQVRLYLTSTRDSSGTAMGSDSSGVAVGGRRGGGGGGGFGLRSATAAEAAGPWTEAAGLDFSPSDASQFVIATTDGLFHTNRFGSACAPALYTPTSSLFGSAVPAPLPTCVQYSTADSRLLVAGYDDGIVRLFLHNDSQPQLTVPLVGLSSVRAVRFGSTKWHCWVLDDSGTLHLLDFAHKNRDQPALSQVMTQADIGACLCLDVPPGERADNRVLALGFEKGVVQLHTLDSEKLQRPAADRDENWL